MNKRQIYRNNALDILLICCPIVVPIAYLMLLGQFPAHHALIFLAFLVLLGESHFGLTWLFFLDRRNVRWALRQPLYALAVPVALTAGFVALYCLVDTALALLLSSAFSAYHVSMQSAGIVRLYGGRTQASSIAVKIILGSSALFLIVGFLRFYNPFFDGAALLRAAMPGADPYLLAIVLIAVPAALVVSLGRLQRENVSYNFLFATLTGSLLYSPYLFVSRPEHAVAMGVGMHWCQYVAITLPLYQRRSQDTMRRATPLDGGLWQVAAVVLAYAILMGWLRIGQAVGTITSYDFSTSFWVVIPVALQNLHYYSEMFTWRLSDPHLRETVGKYVFTPQATTQAARA